MILAGFPGLDPDVARARNIAKLGDYSSSALSVGPIAYWWLIDSAGSSTAEDLVDPLQSGTHTNVVVAEYNGHPRPYYNATAYTNVHSATLNGVFSGAAGTLLLWAKVANSGVWTDSTNRSPATFYVNGNHWLGFLKTNANNTLRWTYRAGGVQKDVSKGSVTETGWMCLALTWDAAADEVKAYYNGEQEGLTQNGLGAWAGNMTATRLGSYSTATYLWYGWLAHAMVFDTALSATTIAALSS